MRTQAALVVSVLVVAAAVEGCGRSERSGSARASLSGTQIYKLTPPGPPSTHGPQMAALAEGRLSGALVHGKVRTWLAGDGGGRTLVAWPQTFRARLHPLELLNDRRRIVARGGELVSVGGGFRPNADGRPPGERKVFLAWNVSSRAIP